MNRIAKLCRTFVVATSALAFAVTGGFAAPRASQPAAPKTVVTVQADCYAVGQRVAAEMGGRLASVSSSGGNCVVLVLMPAKDGQPPRRERVVVPAN
jgi:hypothetical protein